MNLAAYLTRIGFRGTSVPPPTLSTLKELHRLHPQAIPFENLDPILGRPVSMSLNAVEKKLVDQKRGGYCYEQNILFMNALREIGYKKVQPLSGRVYWIEREGYVPPRTHMLLLVEVEDTAYLADVGFGSATFSGPLRFVIDEVQELPLNKVRLVDVKGQEAFGGSEYLVQIYLKETWKNVYAFHSHQAVESDLEVSNFYVSAHPSSIFKNKFMAAVHGPDYSATMANCQMKINYLDGREENSSLTPEQAVEKLHTLFGIDLPESVDLGGVFARL